MTLSEQIGALADHYLLVKRGGSSVSKRIAPKHTAALNADSRVTLTSCYTLMAASGRVATCFPLRITLNISIAGVHGHVVSKSASSSGGDSGPI